MKRKEVVNFSDFINGCQYCKYCSTSIKDIKKLDDPLLIDCGCNIECHNKYNEYCKYCHSCEYIEECMLDGE